MATPGRILALVARFREQIESYSSGRYNETQLRREFIDPMFEALGWDVSNTRGYAEIYKDVVHEESIKIGGSTKAPDYGFRIGGTRKFFLEAKKPSINIQDDVDSGFQLRRYAWSAKLPLSILTNFREFAVYDCRIQPKKTDRAAVARIQHLTFEEYDSKWSDIASIFARESILKGSFDKYAESTKLKRGTMEVDDAFLAEISEWREELARNLALRNQNIDVHELNSAVQQTIDRIIFLRMAEDRGVEPYGRLRDIASEHNLYTKLGNLFRQADDRYNSGLFHFKQSDPAFPESLDALTLGLTLDDAPLRKILSNLYYPDSPYEFSVLSADILGQIYEQFLGKVIRLRGRSAVVIEKPELKRAGGIYYTPPYIVEYVVGRTIKPLLQGKTPATLSGLGRRTKRKLSPLTILDPACGSGSFLIQAYQCLLDWYLIQYLDEGTKKHARGREPRLYQTPTGEWRLTIAERRRILLTHIFGVDIDRQAVEVTKLSLLLKVLEGESGDAIARQMHLFQMRALPDLAANIKCGNSLIGRDFFEEQPSLLVDRDVVERINPFDWNRGFPAIISSGGFSVVIGNPPYRRELDYKHLMDDIAATSFGQRFRSARMDLWYYFVHRSLDLLDEAGRLGFIVNSYWISGTGAEKLIDRLQNGNLIEEMFYFGALNVFKKVSGNHMILLLRRGRTDDCTVIKHCLVESEKSAEPFVRGTSPTEETKKNTGELFLDGKVDIEPGAVHRLAGGSTDILDKIATIRQGIAENPSIINRKVSKRFGGRFRVGAGVFLINAAERKAICPNDAERKLIKPYHDLQDIGRYYLNDKPPLSIIYSTPTTAPDPKRIPNLIAHLRPFKAIMDARRETKNGSNMWWHLHWPRDLQIWKADKIIALQMAKRPSFALAAGETYSSFSTNVIVPKNTNADYMLALLGILNSTYVWKWLQHHAKRRGVALEVNGNVLRRIPIPHMIANSSNRRDELTRLVEARIRAERELQRRDEYVGMLEEQIDRLVERLYSA